MSSKAPPASAAHKTTPTKSTAANRQKAIRELAVAEKDIAVAELAMTEFLDEEKLAGMAPSTEAIGNGSLKRGVQQVHRFGPERVKTALACLNGQCAASLGTGVDAKLMCIRQCGRGVHALSCCMFSKGVAQLGNLICAHCRAQDLVNESFTPSQKMVERYWPYTWIL